MTEAQLRALVTVVDAGGFAEAARLLLVLDGAVDLRVGDRAERLSAGDSAAFAGDIAHGYAAPADVATPARFALTVFEPNVGGGRT